MKVDSCYDRNRSDFMYCKSFNAQLFLFSLHLVTHYVIFLFDYERVSPRSMK